MRFAAYPHVECGVGDGRQGKEGAGTGAGAGNLGSGSGLAQCELDTR